MAILKYLLPALAASQIAFAAKCKFYSSKHFLLVLANDVSPGSGAC